MTNQTITIIFKPTGEVFENIVEGGISKAMDIVNKVIKENHGLVSTQDFNFMKSHLFKVSKSLR